MNTTKTIKACWNAYDKALGKAHLLNYGIIFLDEYNCPIDDEYILEELAKEYTNSAGKENEYETV